MGRNNGNGNGAQSRRSSVTIDRRVSVVVNLEGSDDEERMFLKKTPDGGWSFLTGDVFPGENTPEETAKRLIAQTFSSLNGGAFIPHFQCLGDGYTVTRNEKGEKRIDRVCLFLVDIPRASRICVGDPYKPQCRGYQFVPVSIAWPYIRHVLLLGNVAAGLYLRHVSDFSEGELMKYNIFIGEPLTVA